MRDDAIQVHEFCTIGEFSQWLTLEGLACLLHEWLKPYEDTVADIMRGIKDALAGEAMTGAKPYDSPKGQRGGFVLVAETDLKPLGALVMLRTGMKGYVPENILLFVAVDPSARGEGLGSRLVKHAIALCDGNVKLHVEYENPAKRLYERLGFTNKYAEMRYEK